MGDTSRRDSADDGYVVGWFRWNAAENTWDWSDGMFQIHGLAPGEVRPTLELLLAHKHPEDRERVEAAIRQAMVDGQAYSYRHRLIDMSGREHSLITAGDGDVDDDGKVVALHGSLIDVTDVIAKDAQALAGEVFSRIVEQRAGIEQAKGALMAAYGLADDEAFALLRWHSQQSNIKLHDLADELISRISSPEIAEQPVRRKLSVVLAQITDQRYVVPSAQAGADLISGTGE